MKNWIKRKLLGCCIVSKEFYLLSSKWEQLKVIRLKQSHFPLWEMSFPQLLWEHISLKGLGLNCSHGFGVTFTLCYASSTLCSWIAVLLSHRYISFPFLVFSSLSLSPLSLILHMDVPEVNPRSTYMLGNPSSTELHGDFKYISLYFG